MQFKENNMTITFKGHHVPLPDFVNLPSEISTVMNFVLIISCLSL